MEEDSVVQVLSRSKRRAKPRWQRRKEARPVEIVAAALQVFADHGFATSTLEEVARRAGVTKGTVYLYFDSKEALLKSVVRETIVPAIAQGEALAQSFRGSARELLTQIIRDFWQFLCETPASALPKLMVAEAANFPELARFYHHEVASGGPGPGAIVLRRNGASCRGRGALGSAGDAPDRRSDCPRAPGARRAVTVARCRRPLGQSRLQLPVARHQLSRHPGAGPVVQQL